MLRKHAGEGAGAPCASGLRRRFRLGGSLGLGLALGVLFRARGRRRSGLLGRLRLFDGLGLLGGLRLPGALGLPGLLGRPGGIRRLGLFRRARR